MMPKMIDMKMPKKSGNKAMLSMGNSDYPYGLQLSLNKDTIKKLGLESEDLAAGSLVDFCITVQVVSSSIEPGDKDVSRCEMQIIKMGEMEEADDMDQVIKKEVTYSKVPSLKSQGKVM